MAGLERAEISLSQTISTEPISLAAEWRVLLECVNPLANDARLRELLRPPLDWPSLLTLAEDHGVTALTALRLQTIEDPVVPAEIRALLRDRQRAQTIHSLSMAAELFRLLDRFAANGVEMLTIKGPVLSVRCYGDPAMRQYADLDLVLRAKDIRRVTVQMTEMGYRPDVPLAVIDAGKTPGEYAFTKLDARMLVEFHTEGTFRYHPRTLPLEGLFKRQIRVRFDSHEVPALSTEDELVLISIHAAKHFWQRLMWIADVAALVSRQGLDWKQSMAVAAEVGAERMLRLGLRLAQDVLGMQLPGEVAQDVNADKAEARLVRKIVERLPAGDSVSLPPVARAAFRLRMREGLLPGISYLLRLSLSPTEEDWAPGAEVKRSSLIDAIGRPFRLARKYRRD